MLRNYRWVCLATGGANSVTLSVNEMPSHAHMTYHGQTNTEATGYGLPAGGGFLDRVIVLSTADKRHATLTIGGSGAHNNMPAYQTLYAWRRTA